MRHKFLTLLLLTLFVVACKKTTPNSEIVGKWSIEKDSTYMADTPPFFNAGPGGIYTGVNGDYYDFRPDGKLIQ